MRKLLAIILIATLLIGVFPINADSLEWVFLRRKNGDDPAYVTKDGRKLDVKVDYAGEGLVLIKYPKGYVMYEASGKRLGPEDPNAFYEYDEFYNPKNSFSDGIGRFELKDHNKKLVYFLKRNGEIAFTKEFNFEQSQNVFPFRFSEGLMVSKMGGKNDGYLDKIGKLVISLQGYKELRPFCEGLAPVSQDGEKWGYIDKTGKTVIPMKYRMVGHFSEGLAPVQDYDTDKWGFIDMNGEMIIAPKFDQAGIFEMFYTFQYPMNYGFSGGLAPVAMRNSDNKMQWGYIDKSGKAVINYKYDYAIRFSEGLAAVAIDKPMKNEKINQTLYMYGFIDTKGRLVHEMKHGVNYTNPWQYKNGIVLAGLVDSDNTHRLFSDIFMTKEGKKYDVSPIHYAAAEGMGKVEKLDYSLQEFDHGYAYGEVFVDAKSPINPNVLEYRFVSFLVRDTISKKANTAPVIGDFEQIMLDTLEGKKPQENVSANAAPTVQTSDFASKAQVVDAVYSSMNIKFNGKLMEGLEVYNIGGSSYFKLRDIAMMFSATSGKFSVDYNNEKKLISITSKKDYKPTKTELQKGDGKNKKATDSNAKLEVNQKEKSLQAYNIGGNNYYKLRDLAEALDFEVGYDNSAKMILINTK